MIDLSLADRGKKLKPDVTARARPQAVVELYNTALHVHLLLERKDVNTMVDNEALDGICRRDLYIGCPTYTNLRGLISPTISVLTSTLNANGTLSIDVEDSMHAS